MIFRKMNQFLIPCFGLFILTLYGCGSGGGAGSPASNTKTPAANVATPSGVAATAGNTQITVTWPAVPGASGYNLYCTNLNTQTDLKIADVTSPYVINGLANATPYLVWLTALDSSNVESNASNSQTVTTGSPGTGAGSNAGTGTANGSLSPSTPTGLTVTPGDGQATVTWSPVAGATSYFISYKIFINGYAQTPIYTYDVTSPKTLTGLQNGQLYEISVYASNSAGDSFPVFLFITPAASGSSTAG